MIPIPANLATTSITFESPTLNPYAQHEESHSGLPIEERPGMPEINSSKYLAFSRDAATALFATSMFDRPIAAEMSFM
jgi:hypothetical protein